MEVPDGVYPDWSFDEYASVDAINQTFLKEFAKSAKRAQYWRAMGGREATPAMEFGRALHIAILEPQHFDREVMTIPKLDKRTKAGKAAWTNFQRMSEGRIIMDPEALERTKSFAHSIMAHKMGRTLFESPGRNEVSIVWTDPVTGLKCKARLDRVTGWDSYSVIADLKSCQDVEKYAFQRTIGKLSYDIQGGFSLMGLDVLRPIPSGSSGQRVFVWLAVESEGPWEVGVYEMVSEAVLHAQQRIRRMLKAIKVCKETGVWPGKCGEGIESMDLAEHVYKKEPLEDR